MPVNEFNTVFEISRSLSEVESKALSRLVIVSVLLFLGVIGVVVRLLLKRPLWHRTGFTALSLLLLGLISVPITVLFWLGARAQHRALCEVYEAKEYRVVEGTVQVLRTQPADGHAPGDLVRIGDRKFEIDYYNSTDAYKQTVAHGGYLCNGAYVRIFYWGNRILRVDVKSSQ